MSGPRALSFEPKTLGEYAKEVEAFYGSLLFNEYPPKGLHPDAELYFVMALNAIKQAACYMQLADNAQTRALAEKK